MTEQKKKMIALIKEECARQGVDNPLQVAYILATAEWETAHTMLPVREAFWMSEQWRKIHLKRYYPYYGRGLVQLTWKSNYAKFGKMLNLDLVGNPDLALDPKISVYILVKGMKDGLFTGKKLENYINADKIDLINARRIVNGIDKAHTIASLATHTDTFA